MTETYDFVDIIKPVLEAGTWTNLGHTPKITVIGKSGPSFASSRGNKNERIEIKNEEGMDSISLTFDGTPIVSYINGQITFISTSKSDRNKMKTDILTILRAGNIACGDPRINNNPSLRNKDSTTYFFQILK